MKGIIKKIPLVKQWDGPKGTLYFHTLEMEDGKEIQLGKKTENAFKTGQEIEYESYEINGKVKFKEITDFKGGGGSKKEDPYRQMLILAQSSTHRAVELVATGAITFEQLEAATGKLMDIQIKLAKERI